jgi:RNA polymerase sigma factor (sigma-70 family)
MDKLTALVIHYKDTHDNNDIKSIQNIITPIIKRLLNKWHFDNFPFTIRQELIDDSKTIILCECLNKYNPDKGNCKFSSYYATSENFYLRRQYMTYFQKGKPIQKHIGRLNTDSLNALIDKNESNELEDFIKIPEHTRQAIDIKRLKEVLDKLNNDDRKLIEEIFFNNLSISKVSKKLKIKRKEIEKNKNKVINFIKNNI